jgi:hypothetical protein
VQVLLTQPAHYRGTNDFVARYGASVWVPPRAVWRRRPNPATTGELPRGVEAIELDGEPQQVVFFIRDHATLVTGDVLSGTGGVLHVFVDEADPERLLPSLDALGSRCLVDVVEVRYSVTAHRTEAGWLISSLNAGSSRIGSKSESPAANERSRSLWSIASRRCSIASDVRPARLSQHATL